jgi:hypothetical protein
MDVGFDVLSHAAQERVRWASNRWLSFRRTSEFDASPIADQVFAQLERIVTAWQVDSGGGVLTSLDDLAGVILPCASELVAMEGSRAAAGRPDDVPAVLLLGAEALGELFCAVDVVLARYSRPDGRIYRATRHSPDWRETVELHAISPPRRTILVEHAARPVWRLLRGVSGEPLSWSSVGDVGAPAGSVFEVWAQGHLLDRVAERAGFTALPGLAERGLNASLNEPTFVRFGSGWATRYRVSGVECGYVPLAITEGAVVARTLLLSTLRGTPEGDRLHAHLRTSGRRAEELRLDRLDTFVTSDPFQDQAVGSALRASDLGGLAGLRGAVEAITSRVTDPAVLR